MSELITAGTAASRILPAGTTMALSGNGLARYTPPGTRQRELVLTGGAQYIGPFSDDLVVDLQGRAGGLEVEQTARKIVTQDPVSKKLFGANGEEISSVSGGGNAAVVTIAAPDGYDVGDVLTATPSTGWTVTGYQWTRDGVDIAGATSSTYTLVSADGGKLIGCRAVSAVFSAFATIPSYAPTLPAGYLSLDSSVLTLDSSVLSLV